VIIVDTSVVVAIVRHEEEESIFTEILDQSSAAIMSAVSYVETYMVVTGRRSKAESKTLESVIAALSIEIADVTNDQAGQAIRAFTAYGKGRHPAGLNLADCFAYALAKSRGAPLLFKGDDFIKTDIAAAWRP
jgi:ribonuclease VapC